MEQGEGRLDAEGEEDQQHSRPGRAQEAVGADQLVEDHRPRAPVLDDRPRQEEHAGGDLDHEVAHAGAKGALGAPGPDQEHRGDRRQLPVHEEGQQVAGEDGADRRADVEHHGDLLETVLHVNGVDGPQDRRDVEDVAEEEAQPVHPHHGELGPEELHVVGGAGLQGEELGEGEGGHQHGGNGPPAPGQQGDEQPAADQDHAGRDASDHSSPRRASRTYVAAWRRAPG